MFISKKLYTLLSLGLGIPLIFSIGLSLNPDAAVAKEKVKVLYHVDGKDLDTAKYAMALINKHIEAEGGPDNIDVKLIVHGPALHLFKVESIDPGLKAKLKTVIDKKFFQNYIFEPRKPPRLFFLKKQARL